MSCDKAWSCQELVDHADNWSLAGNVGLLKHMEQFAEDLFQQVDATNNHLENLLQELDSTEIQLDLVKNQFLGLQNTQFIESRVYEDDETQAEVTVEPAEPKVDDARKKELLKGAVLDGLKVLDKYYERVSIPESDSEGDETDCSNFVLREKDPYINRPLPYVIGSEEWHTKWHAGLAESSDDSDGDDGVKTNGRSQVEDEFSDTDSESNLPVADRRSEAQNINNYPHNAHIPQDDDIYQEVNGNSVSAKTPITNSTFAEQLAAKLGDVRTTPGDPEVNTRPIQRIQPSVGNSLLHEVPPEIPDDHFGGASTGLFSGGGGLFDDDHDDDSFGEKPPPIVASSNNAQKKVPNLFDEDDDDDFLVGPPPIQAQAKPAGEKKRVGSLFDETDDETDEESVKVAESYVKKTDTGPVFIPQVPPVLEPQDRKKPIGGVNVLGGFLPRRQASSSTSSSASVSVSDETSEKNVMEVKTVDVKVQEESAQLPPPLVAPTENKDNKLEKRVLSLFDDTDDLFEDDLFLPTPAVVKSSPEKPKTKKRSLFDEDESNEPVPPPLFSSVDNPPEVDLKKTKTKTRNLFDESSEEEDDMFGIPKALPPKTSTVSYRGLFADTDSIFKEETGEKEEKARFESEDSTKSLETNDLFSPSPLKKDTLEKPVAKPRISLFDDKPPLLSDDDNWDDVPAPERAPVKIKEPAFESQSPSKKKELKDLSVVLVEEENKQKNIQIENITEEKIKSPQKSLPGKLKHNLNINVNALMPGARLPKTQSQSQESTKIADSKETVDVEESMRDVTPQKIEDVATERKIEDKVVQNEANVENTSDVSVLSSVTKTRARIMLKRRPSTRQGRKAALASSQSQPQPQTANSQEPAKTEMETSAEKQNQPSEEAKEIVTPPMLHQSNDEIMMIDDGDIFDDVKPQESEISLFDEDFSKDTEEEIKPSSSAMSTPRKQLIVEDVEDEEGVTPPPLFAENVDVHVVHEDKVDVKPPPLKKISLFDDLDDFQDSDDLFASVSHSHDVPRPQDLFSTVNTKKTIDNVRVFDTSAPLPTLPTVPTLSTQSNVSNNDSQAKSIDKNKMDKLESPLVEKKSGGLFGDLDDEDDLFAHTMNTTTSKSSKVMAKVKKPNKSLFGDDDDEDDLFASSSSSKASNIGARTQRETKIDVKPKGGSKSLFGDDDDDDIFSNRSSKKLKSANVTQGTKKIPTSSSASTIAMPSAVKNDPLADLFGDSD